MRNSVNRVAPSCIVGAECRTAGKQDWQKNMTPFPEYKKISVADLIPYARNSRTHSEAQVAKLAASIKEFGFLNPIITDGENGIVAGHGRVMAAQKLGLDALPCIEAGHLTEAQKRAYIIADNRMALDAGWDNDLLKIELQDLDGEGFDLSLTGFEIEEVAQLFDEPNFEPGTEDDQGKLDELAPKMVTCPHCAAEWDLREHGQG
jgi:ParB-like chromosome segregation protein Spo0J